MGSLREWVALGWYSRRNRSPPHPIPHHAWLWWLLESGRTSHTEQRCPPTLRPPSRLWSRSSTLRCHLAPNVEFMAWDLGTSLKLLRRCVHWVWSLRELTSLHRILCYLDSAPLGLLLRPPDSSWKLSILKLQSETGYCLHLVVGMENWNWNCTHRLVLTFWEASAFPGKKTESVGNKSIVFPARWAADENKSLIL